MLKERLLLVGNPYGCLGIPIHFRALAKAFISYQQRFDVKIMPLFPIPQDSWHATYGQDNELEAKYISASQVEKFAPTHIFMFWSPDIIASFLSELNLDRSSYKLIVSWPFEYTVFPQAYIDGLKLADIIAPTSSWARDIIKQNGIDTKQIIFHCGIDPIFEASEGHKVNDHAVPGTRFIFVGKLEERKAFKEALITFDRATKGLENQAHLKVLSFSQIKPIDLQQYIQSIVPGNSNIFPFYSRIDTPEKMRILYEYSDFLLFPSRAEGIGLPLLEAMSTGCLPISGNWSGMIDYIPKDYPFMIRSEGESDIYDPVYFPNKGVGKWQEPDWEHLQELIKQAINMSTQTYNDLSFLVKQYTKAYLSWANIINKFVEELD